MCVHSAVVTTGWVHTALNNLCNYTGVVSTPPSLVCVASSRAVGLDDSTVAVKKPILKFLQGSGNNGNNGLIGGFTVT